MKNYQFHIPGKPQGKQRPRTTRTGHIYTPKQTKEYEKNVVDAFLGTNPEATLITNPCKITITAKFGIPKSYSRKKVQEAIRQNYYTGKPDSDNIVKIVMDGLNGVAYEDDKLVVEIHATKKYTLGDPGVTVKIEEIEPHDPEGME